MSLPLYQTGFTQDGKPLIGGVWRLFHQDGFPLELSAITLGERGCCVDYAEAMLDASTDNNLPALMTHLESFLSAEVVESLKQRFMLMLQSGSTIPQMMVRKRGSV